MKLMAGVKNLTEGTPPVKGEGWFAAPINAMKKAGSDGIFVVCNVPAVALTAFGLRKARWTSPVWAADRRFVFLREDYERPC
jgi:histidinol dehydrogenase